MSRKKRIGALTEVHFSINIVTKRNLKAYREVRQLVISKCDSLFYYKLRRVLPDKVRRSSQRATQKTS